MFNPLRARTSSKVLLAWMAVTAMLIAAHVVQAKTQAQPQLDASGEPSSLIAETTGKRTIQFGIPRQRVSGAASLVVSSTLRCKRRIDDGPGRFIS